MINEAKENIERGISEGIKALGFKKKKYFYYKLIKPNIYATIGVGSSSAFHEKCRAYSIQLGILYENVERIAYELTGINKLALMKPTMSTDIGYLMPENRFKKWELSYEFSNEKEFSEMFKAIETYGNEYWGKYSNSDVLFHAFYIREAGIQNVTRDKYLPILYYIRGEKEKGLQVIENAIARMGTRHTDEELRWNQNENMAILRAGEGSHMSAEEMEKLLRDNGSFMIVAGDGVVSPEYLEFREKYMQLD